MLINAFAQNFPPAAGQPGSTAIHKDSAVFISWAGSCIIERRFINISDSNVTDQGSNYASYGDVENALGVADNLVVSLGDGGMATLYFESPVRNNTGFDFAVFENSFNDNFLELAFVEVSSDGNYFVRFPSYSNTQTDTQIDAFGEVDPTYIHNLAGKYRISYGTPFDLIDLADSSNIDLNNIHYIRIVDAIGSIEPAYSSFDVNGNIINDPWPTPFYNCGFDLDAVGILEAGTSIISHSIIDFDIELYPNPAVDIINLNFITEGISYVFLYNRYGLLILSDKIQSNNETNVKTTYDLSELDNGIYIMKIVNKKGIATRKILKGI